MTRWIVLCGADSHDRVVSQNMSAFAPVHASQRILTPLVSLRCVGFISTRHALEVVASLNRYLKSVLACHAAMRDARGDIRVAQSALKRPPLAELNTVLAQRRQVSEDNATGEGSKQRQPSKSGERVESDNKDSAADVGMASAVRRRDRTTPRPASNDSNSVDATTAWAARALNGSGANAVVTEAVLLQEMRQRTFEEEVRVFTPAACTSFILFKKSFLHIPS